MKIYCCTEGELHRGTSGEKKRSNRKEPILHQQLIFNTCMCYPPKQHLRDAHTEGLFASWLACHGIRPKSLVVGHELLLVQNLGLCIGSVEGTGPRHFRTGSKETGEPKERGDKERLSATCLSHELFQRGYEDAPLSQRAKRVLVEYFKLQLL